MTIATDMTMAITAKRTDEGWVVWFGSRRTPIAVEADSREEAISKARKNKKRGGDSVVSARKATASEKKTAASGGWVRTGPNGEKPGESRLRGQGPKPKSYRGDTLTPTEQQAYDAALESRKDEITQWRNDGKSEIYIETRIIEGLRNDGVIGEEDVPRMDVKFLNEALHQRVVAEAKRKFAVWPSAYASAWVVAEYKRRNGKFRGDDAARVDAIDKWFQEKWVRISGSGEVMGSCGDKGEGEGKPKCLPLAKARSMSKEERIAAVRRKRREDPNPDRKGKAIMVSTKGKR